MKQTHVVLLLIIGFLFRVWFSQLVPQPFVYDQDQYYGYALGIIHKGLWADTYRLYGYPLIIAPLIYFFGVSRPLPWTIFHAFLDTSTALLIWAIARKIMPHSKVSAVISFLLYLFNPITSAYVGVLLSEITTIFLVTLIIWLYLDHNQGEALRTLILVFLLGFLPQVRPSFIFFSLILASILLFKVAKSARGLYQRVTMVALPLMFFLPFLYTVISNFAYYKQFSPLSVDNVFARELYTSLYIGRGLPFTDTQYGNWPPEALIAWGEFALPKNAQERTAVADKYLRLAVQKIQSDPVLYTRSRLAKMFYIWEKHFLFPYNVGTQTEFLKGTVYWSNIVLLILAASGLVLAIRGPTHRYIRSTITLSLFLIGYISLVHALSTSEERFSLPGYPMVFLFTGYALSRLGILWQRLPPGGLLRRST